LIIGGGVEPTKVNIPPQLEQMAKGISRRLALIFPPELAAIARMMGMKVAVHEVLFKNALMTITIGKNKRTNLVSEFLIFLTTALPTVAATPVSNREAPTMIIPQTSQVESLEKPLKARPAGAIPTHNANRGPATAVTAIGMTSVT
jgi:hypothetical protein